MDEITFRAKLAALGCNDVYSAEWEPGKTNPEHTHDFEAHVLILDGEFTLTTPAGAVTYAPGQWCELAPGTPHFERAGPMGAKLLAGRIHPKTVTAA